MRIAWINDAVGDAQMHVLLLGFDFVRGCRTVWTW